MPNKLMLIEDDHTMVTLLNTLLRFEGYEVVSPRDDDDVETMLAHVREESPDVILMDVHLRQLSGLELLREIRKEPDLSDIYIIMSSGMDLRERCLELGANDFILKPYMPDDLLSKIRIAAGK